MDQQTLYELIVYGLHPPLSRKVRGLFGIMIWLAVASLT